MTPLLLSGILMVQARGDPTTIEWYIDGGGVLMVVVKSLKRPQWTCCGTKAREQNRSISCIDERTVASFACHSETIPFLFQVPLYE